MIVILGASGFIGTYLVDELISAGKEVFATGWKNLPRDYYKSHKIPFAQVDLGCKADFEQLPKEKVDAVVICSAHLPANVQEYNPQHYIDINVTGTLNALEYCRGVRAGKVILTSSHSDVAQLWNIGRAITEEDQRAIVYTGDHAMYIISKITAEEIVKHYEKQYGISGIVFRLPAVYGYGPHSEIYVDGRPRVPGFEMIMREVISGGPVEIWGDPSKGRDLVYVKDVAHAFVQAIDSNNASGLYNIASGVRTSLEEEVRGMIDVFSDPGIDIQVIYRPEKPNYMTYLYDIRKAQRDFGYKIKYPYKKMLEDYKWEMQSKRFEHLVRRENKSSD
jgi:UDP-glucose 4-epimerase